MKRKSLSGIWKPLASRPSAWISVYYKSGFGSRISVRHCRAGDFGTTQRAVAAAVVIFVATRGTGPGAGHRYAASAGR